ncbi:hypothetical protein Bca4012_063085 [Brassica carinata]
MDILYGGIQFQCIQFQLICGIVTFQPLVCPHDHVSEMMVNKELQEKPERREIQESSEETCWKMVFKRKIILLVGRHLRFDYAFGAGSSLFMDEISSLDDEDLQGRSYDGEEGRDLGARRGRGRALLFLGFF